MSLIDETGNRYGGWTVIKRDGSSIGRMAVWLCQCDCGTTRGVVGSDLRGGRSKSCGCMYNLPAGMSTLNWLISHWKIHAKQRGYGWNLTREQVATLTKQTCHYCGKEPEQIINLKECKGEYIYNGLDRVDNNKGYTTDNVVPCCGTCNSAKMAMSYKDFLAWVERVYKHRINPRKVRPCN